jgi:hypothetical protein
MGVLLQAVCPPFLFFLFVAAPLKETTATTVLWTAPAILISALMIAWPLFIKVWSDHVSGTSEGGRA